MATSVQQRGETAVLGLGPPSHHAPLREADFIYQASPLEHRSQARTQEARLAARGVARRKLRRRENARLASNPHVVKPSPIDFALHHPNRHTASFPLPEHLQHLRLPSRPTQLESSNAEASSSVAGLFNLTYPDAHFFLAHRVGVRPGHDCPEEDTGVLQAFTKRAESELRAWLSQEVFIAPDRHIANSGADDETLINLNTEDDTRDFRILQISKSAHNLVWQIPDSFLRLAIHCLARVLHCPSFSKDGPTGRQTWILNPRPGAGNAPVSMSHSMIDTPPTTDVGTDIASDFASEIDSDWAVSEMDESESLVLIDSIHEEEDTIIVPYRIDEEDDSLADIEDE